ncbi:AAA family ATPase [Thiohalobacter sp. IOR34]|uniref:ExeA family protein n=1 Tax=Thiohalobacter sp. IOR34 TaxID=3057176 RepID=UPI0025B1CEFA|nr:AAA family ATPase [Thiohalobacter sp. IOR34]WJW75828.1 AAA family ATPase [Thiohalobacter sp. IOR34]
MYADYFGLTGRPFSIAPDPRYLYLSERHREALAHLLYGIGEGGGFVQLTGEVGTGKTTLCRALLEQIPDHVDVALILNPRVNALELVATVCDELGIDYPQDGDSLKRLIDALNAHLLETHAAGRRTVLIVDEAQNLSTEVLEQLRLLTNLETAEAKLLQIILIGQPELKQLLERNELRQLAQRITARYHLEPLSRDELRAYVRHRLRVSGNATELFSPAALDELQRLSGGIPRLINILCDRALLGAYVEERPKVDRRILRRAAAEVLTEQPLGEGRSRLWWLAAPLMLLLVGAAALWQGGSEAPAVATGPPLEAANDVAPAPGRPVTEAPVVAAVDEPGQAAGGAPAAALQTRLAALDDSAGLQAWAALFRRWQLPLRLDGPAPCEQAEALGMRCLQRSGSWSQLLSYDRPAILQLVDAAGRRVPALLLTVDGERVELQIGAERLWLPLQVLQAHWYGGYTLLWRPPVKSEVLQPGSRSPDVLWLRRQLQRIEGEAPPAERPEAFDAALAEQVKRFQASRGLLQDGVVGAQTLIHLNAADPDQSPPRLQPVTEAG